MAYQKIQLRIYFQLLYGCGLIPSERYQRPSSITYLIKWIVFCLGLIFFNKTENPPKYAKLQFLSTTESHSLFFTDQRGLGVWRVAAEGELWSERRGPDPVNEYEAFRKNVLSNLKAKVSYILFLITTI